MGILNIPINFINIYTTGNQANQINKIILSYVDSYSVVTDATAGIGGNSYYFCKTFKFVNCVEYNYDYFNILKTNISQFSNNKVFCSCYNYIKFLLKQDVIFLDPPWGGSAYKNKKKLNLFLSGIDILTIIDQMYTFTRIVCVKVPNNFNTIVSNFWKISVHNITKSNKCIYKIIIFHKGK